MRTARSRSASTTSWPSCPMPRRSRSTISSMPLLPAGRRELETQLAKARTAGTNAGSILFAAQRQVAQLHKWRLAIEDGAPFSLDAVQPPLHFRRKDLIGAALKTWSAARLAATMAELADAVLDSRRNGLCSPTPSPSARCWRSRRTDGAARPSADPKWKPAFRMHARSRITAPPRWRAGPANRRACCGRRPTFCPPPRPACRE